MGVSMKGDIFLDREEVFKDKIIINFDEILFTTESTYASIRSNA